MALAAMLVDVLARLDRLYDQPLPYMMWLNQRPTDAQEWPQSWFNIEIVSPFRAPGCSASSPPQKSPAASSSIR